MGLSVGLLVSLTSWFVGQLRSRVGCSVGMGEGCRVLGSVPLSDLFIGLSVGYGDGPSTNETAIVNRTVDLEVENIKLYQRQNEPSPFFFFRGYHFFFSSLSS